MKILAINDVESGGGAELVFKESIRLLKKEHLVFSYTAKNTHQLKWHEVASYVFSIKHARKLKELLFSLQPDIVHLHNFYHFLSPSILWTLKKYKKKLSYKVFMTVHDYHFLCANNGCLRWKQKEPQACEDCKGRKYHHILFKQCDPRGFIFNLLKYIQHALSYQILHLDSAIDQFITPSNFLREKMLSFCEEEKLLKLSNPAFGMHKVLQKESKISEAYESIFVGRVCAEKGLKQFIEQDYTPQKFGSFLIVGHADQAYQEILKKIIREKQFEEHISFAGPKPHAEALCLLQAAKRLIFPSICYENCSLTVLEAKALGKEIFHYPIGAISETVNETMSALDENIYAKKLAQIFAKEKSL